MKTMTKIKIDRINRRSNEWILNVLCKPANKVEKMRLGLKFYNIIVFPVKQYIGFKLRRHI